MPLFARETACDHGNGSRPLQAVSLGIAGSQTSGNLGSQGLANSQADRKAAQATSKSLKDDSPPRLPDVATLLNTMRKRLEALNGPDLPRI